MEKIVEVEVFDFDLTSICDRNENKVLFLEDVIG
jgi:hypothetical protein